MVSKHDQSSVEEGEIPEGTSRSQHGSSGFGPSVSLFRDTRRAPGSNTGLTAALDGIAVHQLTGHASGYAGQVRRQNYPDEPNDELAYQPRRTSIAWDLQHPEVGRKYHGRPTWQPYEQSEIKSGWIISVCVPDLSRVDREESAGPYRGMLEKWSQQLEAYHQLRIEAARGPRPRVPDPNFGHANVDFVNLDRHGALSFKKRYCIVLKKTAERTLCIPMFTNNKMGIENKTEIARKYWVSVRDDRRFPCGSQYRRQGPHPELWTRDMVSEFYLHGKTVASLAHPFTLKYRVKFVHEGSLDNLSYNALIKLMTEQTFKLDPIDMTGLPTRRTRIPQDLWGRGNHVYYFAARNAIPDDDEEEVQDEGVAQEVTQLYPYQH